MTVMNLSRLNNMKNLLYIVILCFPIFSNAFATSFVAEVVKIRGNATQLPSNALEAKELKLGDKLTEDTSILTSSKSFVKIKFLDDSEINLGPESKIVITEMKVEKPGIISLLKGRIRTEVKKNEKITDNKFFIKTRSAAMGVRGTDFQTIYNPDNKTTSLLTFKGAVAMAKVEEEIDNDVLNSTLAKKDAVLVPPGQTSFISEAVEKSTLPVKISPVQLNLLYKNQDFYTKNESQNNEKKSKDLSKLVVADQKAPIEGYTNKATGDFAPRAGGFIDLETGIYVAPEKNSILDKKNKVYIPKDSGTINAFTGEYQTPDGLLLDSVKGFVVDNNQGTKTAELKKLSNNLNESLVLADQTISNEIINQQIPFDLDSKLKKNLYTFSIKKQTQTITLDNSALTKKNTNFMSFALGSEAIIKTRFRHLISLEYARNKFENEAASLFAFSTGVKYALSEKIDIFSNIGIFQEQYLTPDSVISRITLTQINFGLIAEIYQMNKYSIDSSLLLTSNFRKRLNGTVIRNGLGYNFSLTPKMQIAESKWLSAGLIVNLQKEDIQSTMGGNSHRRNSSGFEIKYSFEQ